jgi:ATP-dependent Clp protease ATP-binding subunit ClpX
MSGLMMDFWNSGNCIQCGTDASTSNLAQLTNGYLCFSCIRDIYAQTWGEGTSIKSLNKKSIAIGDIEYPRAIKAYLDEYIIGQDTAKKVLSVAVYNHYKRLNNTNSNLSKSNILMVGSTGTGKTLLAKTLADILEVPFTIADATGMVQSGYVGESVDQCIKTLYENSGQSIEATQSGIVFIDELDKIGKKAGTTGRDIAGEGVQQQLLKLIEGKEITFDARNGNELQKVSINTDSILFICGGAFVNDRCISQINDVIDFGIIPELAGRLSVMVKLEDHTVDSLLRIMTEPTNSVVQQYQELFEMEGVDLTFTQGALKLIVQHAINNGTGARGLKSILDNVLMDANYEIDRLKSKGKLVVNEKFIRENLLCHGESALSKS